MGGGSTLYVSELGPVSSQARPLSTLRYFGLVFPAATIKFQCRAIRDMEHDLLVLERVGEWIFMIVQCIPSRKKKGLDHETQ